MHYFRYCRKELFCEGVAIRDLAETYGTPIYVYSRQTISDNLQLLQSALRPLDVTICYAVKANSTLGILRIFAEQGCGFDIVSGGELHRVMRAGGNLSKVVFAGVGKQEWEIELALRSGIYCFNVESESELCTIERCAKKQSQVAPVSLRVNPDIEVDTHTKITTGTYRNKFGVPYEQAFGIYKKYSKSRWLKWKGVQIHIGSQLTFVDPFVRAIRKMLPLVHELKECFGIEFFDIGGGIGIPYEEALQSGSKRWWATGNGERMIRGDRYGQALVPLLQELGVRILVEPGRYLVGNAGILVTRVLYRKQIGQKRFVIVDAGMNDLIRPMLYDAYHQIVPVRQTSSMQERVDIVGPICESGDCFASDRLMPIVKEGELLAIMSAGAYGSSMGSTYNSRPLAAEVLVSGKDCTLIRRRQSIEELCLFEE